MEKKQKVIYDSITGMTKEELTRFLAMVAPTIACRMCPYWDVSEERCYADRDFGCTNEYASSLIAKYLDCPVDGAAEEKTSPLKDCPFCGGKAKGLRIKDVLILGEEVQCYVVACTKCGCTTQYSKTEEEATRDWNRRVSEVVS